MRGIFTTEKITSGKSYWVLLALLTVFTVAVLLLSQITIIRAITLAVLIVAVFFLKKYVLRLKRGFQVLYWLMMIIVVWAAFVLLNPAFHDRYINGSGKEVVTKAVHTEYGLIAGVYNPSRSIRGFAGIPYAKPPVGNLRWKAPQKPTAWTGVRTANRFSDAEVQSNLPTYISKLMYLTMGTDELSHSSIKDDEKTSEDCLYLNIWTGAKSNQERRPVIVYIHGGSFTTGSGSIDVYNGENMAKKGAVFVTINYRLGIFGFYANPELSKESGYNASGNYGILDQIAALKWVRENIAAFGGNPENVTVAGESAGSMSVNMLQASPLAKGLFQRVIGESGGLFGSQGFKHGTMQTLASAEQDGLNLEHNLNKKSIAELRKMPASDLLKVEKTISTRPIVDGYVLHDTIYNTFEKDEENDVPALIGSNANESALFLSLPWPVSMSPDYSTMSDGNFHKAINKTYGPFANQFFKLFPTANNKELVNSELQSGTSQWFTWHMHTWAELQSSIGKSKVYYYYFNKIQPGSSGMQALGAYHSSEIAYAYDNLKEVDLPYARTDYKLSDIMSSYWFNFAKTGDPNGPGLPNWDSYNIKTDQVMQLGDSIKMVPTPNKEQLNFFDDYEASLRKSK
jgi:Carboxylesterase type B